MQFNYTIEKQPAIPTELPAPTLPEAVGDSEIRVSLEKLAGAELPLTMGIIGGLLMLQPLAEGLLARGTWPSVWALASLVGASLCAVAWLLTGALHLPGRWSHPIALLVSGGVLLSQFFAIYVTGQPWPTLTVCILLLGVSTLLVRADWFGVIVAGALLGWFCLPSPELRDPVWLNFGVGLVSAAAIAWRVHTTRAGTLSDLQQFQLEEDRHRRMLSSEIEKTRLAEQRFRAFVSALDAAITVHKDGMIVDANPAAEQLFGYAPGTLGGVRVAALLEAGSAKVFEKALAWGNHPRRQVTGLRRDRTLIALNVASNPAQLGFEQFIVSTWIDCTNERKADDERAAESAELALRQRRTAVLSEAANATGSAGGIVEAAEAVLPLVNEALPSTLGTLFLLSTGGEWRVAASTVPSIIPCGLVLEDCAFANYVAENNENLLLSDLTNDGFGVRKYFPGEKPNALAALPLLYAGRTVAILVCLERDQRVYQQEDLKFLAAMGNTIMLRI